MLPGWVHGLLAQATGVARLNDDDDAPSKLFDAPPEGWSISAIKVLIVIAAALLLFGIIRGVRGFVPTLPLPRVWRDRLERVGPLSELFVWAIFGAISIAWLLEGNRLATIILLAAGMLLVVVAGFFAIRDYFAGVIIRVERFARTGDRIRVGETSGRVRTLAMRHAEVELDNGDIVLLPYSAITRNTITRTQRTGQAPRHTFVVNLPRGLDSSRGQELAYNAVLLNHWAAPKHDPAVRAVSPETLEITVQPIVASRSDDLEIAVRQVLADA